MTKGVATHGVDLLTTRQRRFVMHQDVLKDPVRAAIDAGYTEEYAKTYGDSLQRELLVHIKGAKALAERAEASAPQLIADLTALAFANIFDYFELVDTERGSKLALKQNLKALPLEVQRSVKKIEFDTVVLPDGNAVTVVSKLELHDRTWALKEFIEILRVREKPPEDTGAALEHMDAKDLEQLEAIYKRAGTRAAEAKSKQRDRNAITG